MDTNVLNLKLNVDVDGTTAIYAYRIDWDDDQESCYYTSYELAEIGLAKERTDGVGGKIEVILIYSSVTYLEG